jgi:WD40 repeat protein
MKKLSLIIVFLYCLFLAGCRGQDQVIDEIMPTITPISTVTVLPTESPKATQTTVPSSTPTILPHQLAITAQNASKIVLIKEFGNPRPQKVVWSQKTDSIYLSSFTKISIVDSSTLESLQTIDPKVVIGEIALSSDGKYLFVASKTVQVYDLSTGQGIKTLGFIDGGIRNMAISRDGNFMAIAGPTWPGGGDPDYTFEIISLDTGHIMVSNQEYGIIYSVAISPDGKLAASAGERGIEIYNVQEGMLSKVIVPNEGSIAFGDNSTIIESSESGTFPAVLFDLDTGQEITTIEGGFGSPIFSLNGRLLALKRRTNEIQIRDTSNYGLIQTLSGIEGQIFSVAFSPDGTRLAIVDQGGLGIWNVQRGEKIASEKDFTAPIESVSFSSDSILLFGGINETLTQTWNLDNGIASSEINSNNHIPSAHVVSPNGEIKADEWIDESSTYSPQGAIRLINTRNSEILHDLGGHEVISGEGFTGLVSSLVFNWDGSILASAGYDNTVRLWDINTGQLLITLPPHLLLSDVNFSPDGHYIASSSFDGTVRLWAIPHQ